MIHIRYLLLVGFFLNFYNAYCIINYLDTTFGTDGIVTATIGSNAKINGLAALPDGSIFTIGTALINNVQNLVLTKYNADGTLNNNFGVNGVVSTLVGTSTVGNAVVVDSNNRILVIGTAVINSQNNILLTRYLSNGSLDLNFGNAGQVIKLLGAGATGKAIVIDLNTNILISGTAIINNQSNLYLIRYNPNGLVDNTLGTNFETTLTGDNGYVINALQIDTNSKIVVAGYAQTTNGTNLLLARFEPDGTLDNSFGVNGLVKTEIANYLFSGINSIALNSSNIVATGFAGNGNNTNYLTARYNLDGTLDTSFGSNQDGLQINNIGANSQGNAVLVYNNGQIISAGYSDNKLAVLKYNTNGSLDNSFGINGFLLTSILNNAQANALIFQPLDGKVITGGFAVNGQIESVLIKYNNNNFDFININDISGPNINTKIPIISGTSSLPNAQVDVYVNGIFFKTVTTNQLGNWNAGNTNVLPFSNNVIQVNLIDNSQIISSDLIHLNIGDNFAEDSLFSYSSQNQTKVDSTYSLLPFDNTIRLGTWSYANSVFTCNKSGTYFIEYNGSAGILSSSSVVTASVNVGTMISVNGIEYVGSEANTNLDLQGNIIRALSKSFIINLNVGDQLSLNYAVQIVSNSGFTAGLILNPNYANLQPNYSLSVIRIG